MWPPKRRADQRGWSSGNMHLPERGTGSGTPNQILLEINQHQAPGNSGLFFF